MTEKVIYQLSSPGRIGANLPDLDVPAKELSSLLPPSSLRENLNLPEVSEPEVVRHFVRLSTLNHHVDKGFYPLGSCTMKYNPKINEYVARFAGFAQIHPLQPEETGQGALKLMYQLRNCLLEIAGMDEITLQPSAGAQGELTGLLMIKAFHQKNKENGSTGSPSRAKSRERTQVIIPDSAHGTNPASLTIAGFELVQVKSNAQGLVDVNDLRKVVNQQTAAFMLTNPNTLGLFEKDILEIAKIIHDAGALLYMDGANLNALLGIVRPGDMGFDVVHFNLHKTFSTPHGGGGPGAGPVGVKKKLEPFLPVPIVAKKVDKSGKETFYLDYKRPNSIGKLQAFYGNFAVLVRALTYILANGPDGLRRVAEDAIINANYLLRHLKEHYHLPYQEKCMHELVLSGVKQKAKGVKTMDIAKRLLDFGMYAPTVYFPLIVPEAMMIEPTETESTESLDEFIKAMIQIADEVETNPDMVRNAPHTTPVARLDEVKAAKDLDVRWSG